MTKKYTAIDLFAGAGGLSYGFEMAGFKTLYANDHEVPALETYACNHPNTIVSSEPIENIDPVQLRVRLNLQKGELDVLLGGPPCQGFSTYGQRDSNDTRNQLYQYYLAFLDEFRPKTFVIENVVGILSLDNGAVISDITEKIRKLGYGVTVSILDAAGYGVPQHRKRVFIIGGETNTVITAPEPFHKSQKPQSQSQKSISSTNYQLALFDDYEEFRPYVTVKDAISDLPLHALPPKQTHYMLPYPEARTLSAYQIWARNNSDTLTHHSAKQMLGIRRLRLALMEPSDYGSQIRERLKRGGLPDDTIRELLNGTASLRDTEGVRTEDRKREDMLFSLLRRGNTSIEEIIEFLDHGGFANKYRRLEWDKPSHTIVAHMARDCSDFVHPEIDRFISVREAARIQSFPDRYVFLGSQFRQFRQIGNAVPPLLGKAIAEKLLLSF